MCCALNRHHRKPRRSRTVSGSSQLSRRRNKQELARSSSPARREPSGITVTQLWLDRFTGCCFEWLASATMAGGDSLAPILSLFFFLGGEKGHRQCFPSSQRSPDTYPDLSVGGSMIDTYRPHTLRFRLGIASKKELVRPTPPFLYTLGRCVEPLAFGCFVSGFSK